MSKYELRLRWYITFAVNDCSHDVYTNTIPAHVVADGISMSDNDLVAVLLLFRRGTMKVLPEGGLNAGTILKELLKKRQNNMHCKGALLRMYSHIGHVRQWVASGTVLKWRPCQFVYVLGH